MPSRLSPVLLFLSSLVLTAQAASVSAMTDPAAAIEKSRSAAEAAKVWPDVVKQPFSPSIQLVVSFPGKELITDGEELSSDDAVTRPELRLVRARAEEEDDNNYTVVEVDPDAPDPNKPTYRSFLHFIVSNLKATSDEEDEIESGDKGMVVIKYRKPTPPVGTHRYVFLVYKQPNTYDESMVQVLTPPERTSFDVALWAKDNKLTGPVGVAFFRSSAAPPADL